MKSGDQEFLREKIVPYLGSFGEGELVLNDAQDRRMLLLDGLAIAPAIIASQTRAPETASLHSQMNQNRSLSLKVIRKLINDDYLEKTSIQDLNKKLRRLPEGLVQRFRKRRRILKNRKYALKCRQKGAERENNIAQENASLQLEILQANDKLRKVAEERDEYRQKYARLKAAVSTIQTTSELPMVEDIIL